MLPTSSKEPPKKLLETCTDRDWIEVDYEVLKSRVEGGLGYVLSDESARGLMFVQMVAAAIRMHLSRMMRGTELKDLGIPHVGPQIEHAPCQRGCVRKQIERGDEEPSHRLRAVGVGGT